MAIYLSFLIENSLIADNQSGFRARDSCINQCMKSVNPLMITLKSELFFRHIQNMAQMFYKKTQIKLYIK